MPNKKLNFKHPKYQTIGELGRGGMGVVLKCTDLKLDREVAVKILSWNASNSAIIRFQKEARVLAKMQHPNILEILDFGHSEDDSLFIVMELLRGEDLDRLIKNRSLSFEDSLAVFLQICDGIEHAHGKDVLHRDIKPSNVSVERTASGDIKVTITDFGIAKLLTEDQKLTKTGIGIGSPPYMSPEQAEGFPLDERSDIYSLGCLMYEVLTGEKPFVADTIPQVMFMHLNQPAPTLADKAPDKNFPDSMEGIIAKCLAKSPDDRYENIVQLKSDLEKVTNTFGSASHSPKASDEATKDLSVADNYSKNLPNENVKQLNMGIVIAVTTVAIVIGFICVAATVLRTNSAPPEPTIIPLENHMDVIGDLESVTSESRQKVSGSNDTPVRQWDDLTGTKGRKNLLTLLANTEQIMSKYGGHPKFVDLSSSTITDADVDSLRFIPMEGIRLNNTNISDAGIRTLSQMPSLKEIYLANTKVTTDGISSLIKLPHLSYLGLQGTRVSDKTIETLAKMQALEGLNLHNCKKLEGATLGTLKNLKRLNFLNIGNSSVQRKHLRQLKGFALTKLDATGLGLEDDDLDVLMNMPKLTILVLKDNPSLTKAGLAKLSDSLPLNVIYIKNCNKITDSDIAELKQQKAGVTLKLIR